MNPNSRSLDDAASQDVGPRKLLAKLTSPIGTAVILGVFAVYLLAFYLKFNVPQPDGGVDALLLFGLISQFVGLLCLLVLFRALRDGRLLEFIFVFVFVMPLNSIAMKAAIHASSGCAADHGNAVSIQLSVQRELLQPSHVAGSRCRGDCIRLGAVHGCAAPEGKASRLVSHDGAGPRCV